MKSEECGMNNEEWRMKNLKVENWKLKYLSDYAKRRDFQDEADPTEMKKENLQDFQDCAQREKVKIKN